MGVKDMKPLTVKKRANIYDVAEDADVSVATVSRFLTVTAAISPAKQARIRASIKKLDYRPHPLARSLALTARNAIGLVVCRGNRAFSDLVLADILSGVSAQAGEHALSIHMTVLNRMHKLNQLLDRHRDVVDGTLILDVTTADESVRELLKAGHPAVVMNRWHPTLSCVYINNREGGVLAARHLIEQGHRRIACLVGGSAVGEERLAGYQAALDDAGIKPVAVVNCRIFSQTVAMRATGQLLKGPKPPTALLVASDWMAIGVMREAQRLGRSIPDDLSIVGFDDAIIAEVSFPALTTIRQPLEELGRASVSTILQIKKQGANKRFEKILTPHLVVRKSTAPAS